MAEEMSYRWKETQEILEELRVTSKLPEVYDDILCGADYLELVEDGVVGEYDTVLMLSIDGAQLCESKQLDCWIYIWILVDMAPGQRYRVRNILPGGVIPGPDAPEDLDSFFIPWSSPSIRPSEGRTTGLGCSQAAVHHISSIPPPCPRQLAHNGLC
jgi:hypothetical protein